MSSCVTVFLALSFYYSYRFFAVELRLSATNKVYDDDNDDDIVVVARYLCTGGATGCCRVSRARRVVRRYRKKRSRRLQS